jgi:hypothetical protein
MHHCLEIAEIQLVIFQNFSPPTGLSNVHHDKLKRRNRSLYALALTCSAFRDIALDTLWESHGSLLLLLKTFPADAWEEKGVSKVFVSCIADHFYHFAYTVEILPVLHEAAATIRMASIRILFAPNEISVSGG